MMTELEKELEYLERLIESAKKTNFSFWKNTLTSEIRVIRCMILALSDFVKYEEIDDLAYHAHTKLQKFENEIKELEEINE